MEEQKVPTVVFSCTDIGGPSKRDFLQKEVEEIEAEELAYLYSLDPPNT
jgi:hypothetical protein